MNSVDRTPSEHRPLGGFELPNMKLFQELPNRFSHIKVTTEEACADFRMSGISTEQSIIKFLQGENSTSSVEIYNHQDSMSSVELQEARELFENDIENIGFKLYDQINSLNLTEEEVNLFQPDIDAIYRQILDKSFLEIEAVISQQITTIVTSIMVQRIYNSQRIGEDSGVKGDVSNTLGKR